MGVFSGDRRLASGQHSKREKQIETARKVAAGAEGPHLDPLVLFGRASKDDLANYTPDMLALSARHAATQLKAWTHAGAEITVETVDGIAPSGVPVSLLTIINRDMPFLFDSIMGEVVANHRDIYLAVHPILLLSPGKEPVLRSSGQSGDSAEHVSLTQIHIGALSEDQAQSLVARVRHVVEQVHLAINDVTSMREVLDGAASQLENSSSRKRAELEEARAFLEWLRDDNFIFLGMREYLYSGKGEAARIERDMGRGLGILSDPDVLVLRQGKDAVMTTPEILEFLEGPHFLIVTKANVKSIIHRRAYMDYVGIKRFDADGRVVGELRVVGLFTATAYTHSVHDIPLLRSKVRHLETHFGFDRHSHSGRMLENVLESYPRDDLFQIDADLLARFCEQIMDLNERPRVRVLPRVDHFDRFVSAIVYVPREDYNSKVREKVGTYLADVYDGHVSAYYPAFPDGGVARLHMIIGRGTGKTPRIAQSRLEDAVRLIATPWEARFAALAPEAPRLTVSNAFKEAFSPEDTLADLADITACLNGEATRIAFYRRPSDREDIISLKIFHSNTPLSLSRRVPLLENLGFHVVSEKTFHIESGTDGASQFVVLHDMELKLAVPAAFDLSREGPLLEEAFIHAFEGSVDNDGFNRLVLLAGLSAREVTVLRAYARYLRQAGIVYSQNYIADTLAKYPVVSATIFRLFKDGFDPKLGEKARAKKTSEHHKQIEAALFAVPVLDEDRTLRRFVNAIDATLRTNYFQRSANGQPAKVLAFKLDPKLLDGLPQPKPFREIFVYGTEVEGVHLRFGKVARGGIRWSDRGEDYRTEVLGLVKAQQVKNAVIVPVGAKGGFFPKMLPANGSRDEIFNAGRQAYMTFIRTLLSITDNIVGADVVPPQDTIRVDADDPYFVVAADKGTATFSDTANGLAQEVGFWLDDAFASGGSAGYDHKKMGITARGAWETVKRHFREKDIDIQITPFTVAGVGDMSGDVFGNGMLLSRKIQLLAAFDHRDIFIDPEPDMEKSSAERERLYALPRSSWQNYDRAALSKGAMIISRAEKSVSLTKQAAAAIGLSVTVATPYEIITAILKAPVDLLWFGGIGTYIKSPVETDAEVGDRANDPVRVVATEVRAKVIGEGANLGVTQKGRIAYSLAGGRCNSDAIDNSAGVNCSDVEVNIKIALSSAMADGRLTRAKRDQLLASMTEDVAGLVLRNNYVQSLAISLTERLGVANREPLSRLMSVLQQHGQLNRKVEALPEDAEFAARYLVDKPLTRPEIGVLVSYAKITLFDALIASELPDDPYFLTLLRSYFPAKMQKLYAADIQAHRLHREIIATILANEAVNRGGPAFVQQVCDITGMPEAAVVKAAFLVRDSFGLPKIWAAIDALDGLLSGEVQNALYAQVGELFAEAVRLVLQTRTGADGMDDSIGRLSAAINELRGAIAASRSAEIAVRTEELEAQGVPVTLAGEILLLAALILTPEIMVISGRTGETLNRAIESFTAVTDIFHINRLIEAGERIRTTDHYESLVLRRSIQQIASARRDMVIAALTDRPNQKKQVGSWIDANRAGVDSAVTGLAVLGESGELTVAKISVAAGLLSDLAHGVVVPDPSRQTAAQRV